MHESLRIYDSCFTLLEKEREAMNENDEEKLLELLTQREHLLVKAWEVRSGCDPELLTECLQALLKEQKLLEHKAKMELETLRLALQSSRKENTRLTAYSKTAANGQSAFFMNKEG